MRKSVKYEFEILVFDVKKWLRLADLRADI